MKFVHVELTLNELQEALQDYIVKKLRVPATLVSVVSYNKTMVYAELEQGGLIETFDMKHRSNL